MFKYLRNLRKDDKGATAIEYGLIAALVSIAAIGAMGAMGTQLRGAFGDVKTQIENGRTAATQTS